MKVRDSGMPVEQMWQGFFDPPAILSKLGFINIDGDVVDFGCGFGTFTVAAKACGNSSPSIGILGTAILAEQTTGIPLVQFQLRCRALETLGSIGDSKRFFERRRTLAACGSAAMIRSAQRA
jgi:hypothetical protein